MSEYSQSDEIADTSAGRPHLVILGAGASVAAFPNGDRNGIRLPVMNDFVSILGLEELLGDAGVAFEGMNFEDIYSGIHADPALDSVRLEIEQRVSEYFRQMELPDIPTIYDCLVLSLRPKDVIATFNWDPFLWQACARNQKFLNGQLPHTYFLHGCCIVGFCEEHRQQGRLGALCSECHRPYTPTRLLFPVTDKDYVSDPYISTQWEITRGVLEHAFLFTIFGYGAPESDAAAVGLMSESWGDPQTRNMEEIEIIDIVDEDTLCSRWDGFIHSHHYGVCGNYLGSLLAAHPRRSVEAMWAQFLDAKFVDGNPIPPMTEFESVEQLQQWFVPLLDAEQGQ